MLDKIDSFIDLIWDWADGSPTRTMIAFLAFYTGLSLPIIVFLLAVMALIC